MKADPRQFWVKIGQSIFMGLLSLAIFWKLDGNDFVTQMGLAGFLFFATIFITMNHMQSNLVIF